MAEQRFEDRLKTIVNQRAPRHEQEVEEKEGEVRDAFGETRSTRVRGREAITLDVRLADGRRKGFSYAYMVEVQYEPGDKVTVRFVQKEVVIEGRRLKGLYTRLLEHCVGNVQEGTDTEEGLKPDDAAHIDRIAIKDGEEQAA